MARGFRATTPNWMVDESGTFGIYGEFHASTFQRRDVDNLLKLVLDGLTGVVWVDDVQVAEVSGRIERGQAEPRSEIFVYYAAANGTPPKLQCEGCGGSFRTYRSWTGRRFCSAACQTDVVRKARQLTCRGCSESFTPGSYEQARMYCSPACRQKSTVVQLECLQCGVQFDQWASWRPRGAVLCSADCSVAYWAARPAKIRKGSCEKCGGPVSRREYRSCRSCHSTARTGRSRGPRQPLERRVTRVEKSRWPRRLKPGTPEWEERRRQVMSFIATSVEAGQHPIMAEIGKHLELDALGSVREMLASLTADGWILRQKCRPFHYTILRPIELWPDANLSEVQP